MCYRYLLHNVVLATPLKNTFEYAERKLSNTEKLICTHLNAIGY